MIIIVGGVITVLVGKYTLEASFVLCRCNKFPMKTAKYKLFMMKQTIVH